MELRAPEPLFAKPKRAATPSSSGSSSPPKKALSYRWVVHDWKVWAREGNQLHLEESSVFRQCTVTEWLQSDIMVFAYQ